MRNPESFDLGRPVSDVQTMYSTSTAVPCGRQDRTDGTAHRSGRDGERRALSGDPRGSTSSHTPSRSEFRSDGFLTDRSGKGGHNRTQGKEEEEVKKAETGRNSLIPQS